MNDLISVIIPIYNAEQYLQRCIESVINQTYRNIEIILIDDGSVDDSYSICAYYAGTDKRIHAFRTENHGGGAARNYGINRAKGTFISFVDADDFIDKNMLEAMAEAITGNNTDLAMCSVKQVKIKNKILIDEKLYQVHEGVFDKKSYLEFFEEYYPNVVFCTQGNKLYRTSYINKYTLRYDEHAKNNEDVLFNFDVYEKIRSISVINKSFYTYVIENPLSISSADERDLFPIYTKSYFRAVKFLKKEDIYIENKWFIENYYVDQIINCFIRYYYSFIENRNMFIDKARLILEDKVVAELLPNSTSEKKYKKIILKLVNKKKYSAIFHILRIRDIAKLIRDKLFGRTNA